MVRISNCTAALVAVALLVLVADISAQVDYGNRLGRRVGGLE